MFNCDILDDINPYVCWCYDSQVIPPNFSQEEYYTEKRVIAYEVELVVSSEGGYEIIDGKKYNLTKGDLIFRKPGMFVQWFKPCHVFTILFCTVHNNNSGFFLNPDLNFARHEYVNEITRNFQHLKEFKSSVRFPLHFPTVMHVTQFHEFERLFIDIYNERYSLQQQSHLFTKVYLLQIFVLMYKELSLANWQRNPNKSIRTNYEKIFEIKAYIDKNIRSKFKLDELSNMAGLSPSYFCKIFKKIIGDSPVEYINRSKINAIKSVLRFTEKDIKEIHREFNFDDDSYFFKMFKRYEGITPTAFRNKLQVY